MRDYLLSATKTDGSHTVERVSAATASAAVVQLTSRGFRDVVLHDDDIITAGQNEEIQRELRAHVPAEEELRGRRSSAAGIVWLWTVRSYRNCALIYLGLGIYFVWRRFEGLPLDWLDYVTIASPFVPPLFILTSARGLFVFEQVQRAEVEGRWEDSLRLIPRLERTLGKVPAGKLDMAYLRGKALAALGRWQDAMEQLTPFQNNPAIPKSVYLTRLGSVYDMAHDRTGALACYTQAVEANPKDPAGWIALSETLARMQRPAEARTALKRLDEFELGEQAKEYVPLIEGTIALAELRFADARSSIEAFAAFAEKRVPTLPLMIGVLREAHSLLAIACAGTNDFAAARKYLASGLPHVRRHRGEKLLDPWLALLSPEQRTGLGY